MTVPPPSPHYTLLLWRLLWWSGISVFQRHRTDDLQTNEGARQLLGGGLASNGEGTLGPEALIARLIAMACELFQRKR